MAVELATDKESLLLNLLTQHIRAKVRKHLVDSIDGIIDTALNGSMKDFQTMAHRMLSDDSVRIVLTADKREKDKQ